VEAVPAPAATPAAAPAAATPTPNSTPATPLKAAENSGEKASPVVPSFDVVRVEKDGESVIAGRAAPGATIELLRNDQVHARAAADASGLFALTPPVLPTGTHEIVLQSTAPDGTRQRSRESVTVVINGQSRPLVALAAPDKPTVVLSSPEPVKEASAAPVAAQAPRAPAAEAAAPGVRPEIKITTVESEESGRLYVSGQSAPGATVRLYLNDSFIAPGGSGSDGKLSFSIERGVQPGEYRVRLDEVDPVSGNVKSRAEVGYQVPALAIARAAPSSPSSSATQGTASQVAGAETPDTPMTRTRTATAGESSAQVVIPDIDTAIVSRGDSLWRISHRIYGKGTRYTVIYGANQEQIRNPHLIYPGQVFVLPSKTVEN
jgi:hypothetical protein